MMTPAQRLACAAPLRPPAPVTHKKWSSHTPNDPSYLQHFQSLTFGEQGSVKPGPWYRRKHHIRRTQTYRR